MGALKDWVKQDWVRIGTDGKIKGKCGTSKDKKNPDRCLPRSKANSLSQKERAATAKKKKREGSKGKTFVSNTKAAKVTKMGTGGAVPSTKAKRPFKGKVKTGSVVARGCGAVMANRRKQTNPRISKNKRT